MDGCCEHLGRDKPNLLVGRIVSVRGVFMSVANHQRLTTEAIDVFFIFFLCFVVRKEKSE